MTVGGLARSLMKMHNWLPAIVIGISGSRTSVRISKTGAIYHDLKTTGLITGLGQSVWVDFSTDEPTVLSFAIVEGPRKTVADKAKTLSRFSRAGNPIGGSLLIFSNPPGRLTGIVVDNEGQEVQTFEPTDAGLELAIIAVDPGGTIYLPGGVYTAPYYSYTPPHTHFVGMSAGAVTFTHQFTAGSGSSLENITIDVSDGGNKNIAAMLWSGEVILKNCDIRVTRTDGVGHTCCVKATADNSELYARECGFYSNGDTIWGNHSGMIELEESHSQISLHGTQGTYSGMHYLASQDYPGEKWGCQTKGLGFEWWAEYYMWGWRQINKYKIEIPGAQKIYSWRITAMRQKTGHHDVEWYYQYENIEGKNSMWPYFDDYLLEDLQVYHPPIWTNDGHYNWPQHVTQEHWVTTYPPDCWTYVDNTIYYPYTRAYAAWEGGIMGAGWSDVARVDAHIKDSEGQDWTGCVWWDGVPTGISGDQPEDWDEWDLVNYYTEMIFVNCIFDAGPGNTDLVIRPNSIAYVSGCEIPSYEGNIVFMQSDRATADMEFHNG